ncbi:MAG: zinc metalloprotease HtpX [Methanosarcinales archaeon]|nr:MAG: zinc metalloprotease HtpX [Methanosarcinales archaeon]
MSRDLGLSARMFLTMFLLGVVYLAFITILSYAGYGIVPILIFAGFMLGIQFYFSDKLVLWSTGAKIVDVTEAPRLHDAVERLCAVANLPKPKIAIVNSPIPNAFATGRNKKNAVVAVTSSLMDKLSQPELEAVLAHELSHIKHRDMFVMTLAGFFSTIAFFLMRYLIFFGDRRRGNLMLIWAASVAVWLISFILIRALSRYREFSADRGAALITGNPSNLASALLKISGSIKRVPPQELRKAEGMNAFFIIPAISRGSIMNLFSTHPPVEKRIERLEKLEL